MAEDDQAICDFCAEKLADQGYRVDTAKDGAAAWDALQTNIYHLLITDHSMPKVTGVELLKKLHEARMALPVIMATGTLPKTEFIQYPWLRPSAVLIKPYTTAELLEAVKKVLLATNGTREWIASPVAFPDQPIVGVTSHDDSHSRSIF